MPPRRAFPLDAANRPRPGPGLRAAGAVALGVVGLFYLIKYLRHPAWTLPHYCARSLCEVRWPVLALGLACLSASLATALPTRAWRARVACRGLCILLAAAALAGATFTR